VSKIRAGSGGGEGQFRSGKSIPSYFPQLPHPLHRFREGRPGTEVEIERKAANYPPNCSVNLLIILFKSLSVLRTSSIFSTECRTVV